MSLFAGLILGVFGVLLAWWQDDLTKAEPPAARNRITEIAARGDRVMERGAAA